MSKWMKGLPETKGNYWIRYRLKKGKKLYVCASHYSNWGHYSEIDTIEHGSINLILKKAYHYHQIECNVGDYLFVNIRDYRVVTKKANFDLIEHWSTPFEYIPNISYEEIKDKK